jgi:hypothetical protein
MSGDGLWSWVNQNLDKFVTAFVQDISRIIDIEEKYITNVVAARAEGEGGKLLAAESVDVSFDVSGKASDTESSFALGKRFQQAVNQDDARFTATEARSGVTISATVTSVTNSSSTNAAGASTQSTLSGATIFLTIVLPIMLVLGCIGVAVWKMNQLAADNKASKAAGTRLAMGDVEEVQLSYNRASDAGVNAESDDANTVELTEVKLDAFDLPSAPDPVSGPLPNNDEDKERGSHHITTSKARSKASVHELTAAGSAGGQEEDGLTFSEWLSKTGWNQFKQKLLSDDIGVGEDSWRTDIKDLDVDLCMKLVGMSAIQVT